MPITETSFNCFETRTSDAKKIKRRQNDPRNSKSPQNHLDSPPPPPIPGGGKGGLSKMAQVPEGVYLPICGINYGTRALLQEEVVYEVYRKVKVADL